MAIPQTIQIYLPQGDPAAIRMAEITTRTVRVFDVPRTLLREFLNMREADQVGVYFLIGASDDGRMRTYIGQTGNVGERLKQHADKKEFWDRALVAVSLTNRWTSTHAAYMEWQCIRKATEAGRFELQNGNGASNPHTPEPLEAECREYLETLSVLMSVLGHPILEPLPSIAASTAKTGDEPELLRVTDRSSDVRGYFTTEGMVVLAGSSGLAEITPSASPSTANYRQRLIDQGVATIRDGRFVLLRDHLFGSPSTSASVMIGRNTNGRITWKNGQGLTFQQLEDQKLATLT